MFDYTREVFNSRECNVLLLLGTSYLKAKYYQRIVQQLISDLKQ